MAAELNDQNHAMLYIPPGFAHGFAALTDDVRLMYKCTAEYNPQADAGIRWDDPEIAITWPLDHPIVSEKDAKLPFLKQVDIL